MLLLTEPYRFDLHRIFIGEVPPLFLLEIALRTAIMYAYTLLLLRVIGKRGLGQMSAFDFLVVIALGSAVGDPMFYPDVPVTHGLAVITVVVVLQRAVSFITEKSVRAEAFIEGVPKRLVYQGVIDCESLESEQLDREELFSSLRLAGTQHLGEVERAYIEPSGRISVMRSADGRYGRPLVAACDPDKPRMYGRGETPGSDGPFACEVCGTLAPNVAHACTHCRAERFLVAVR
jgi:uncharacterized membrane protein YcaP (DUF421 family)